MRRGGVSFFFPLRIRIYYKILIAHNKFNYAVAIYVNDVFCFVATSVTSLVSCLTGVLVFKVQCTKPESV